MSLADEDESLIWDEAGSAEDGGSGMDADNSESSSYQSVFVKAFLFGIMMFAVVRYVRWSKERQAREELREKSLA